MKESEAFPFYDFPKPCICSIAKQRFPNLEIISNYRVEIIGNFDINDLIEKEESKV